MSTTVRDTEYLRRLAGLGVLAVVTIVVVVVAFAFIASPAKPAVPVRATVSLHGGGDSDAFTLDAGDYDAHFTPSEQGCVYLLSLNGAAPNLLIPDTRGDASVLDDGAGSGYHLGPDPRDGSCPATWTAVFTPAS